MLACATFVLAALAASASAQLKILAPGGDNLWWVANSENNIVWNCRESQVQNFTVLLANSDVKILTGPQAIVAIQQNFDCSKTLTTEQANFTPATGYTVQFANPLNSTEVYAQTDPFEVKAAGSAYPDASATPSADSTSTTSGSGTGTASGSGASSSSSSSDAITQMVFSSRFLGALLMGAFAALAL